MTSKTKSKKIVPDIGLSLKETKTPKLHSDDSWQAAFIKLIGPLPRFPEGMAQSCPVCGHPTDKQPMITKMLEFINELLVTESKKNQ